MTNDARTLTNVSSSSDQVLLGNGASLPITHSGNVAFSSGSFAFNLSDVLLVPSLHKNLLSIAQLTHDHPVSITFVSSGYVIRHLHTGAILFQGRCSDGLYPVLPSLASKLVSRSKSAFSSTVSSSSLWHRRLGHPSNKVLSALVSQSLLGSPFRLSHNSCSHCALAKSVCLPFSSRDHCSHEPFHLIHSDVWMSPVASFSGFRYYVLFTDDFTRFSWIFPMRLKSEVFHHFSTFVSYVETQFSMPVKQFQSDGGKEFDNGNFKQFCASKGIIHRFSCPHTPQQNGLAERKHRHIADMGRTLLLTAHLPLTFWVEAFCTAVYLINRLPTPLLQWDTPFRRLFRKDPDYSFIRTFGCTCFPYLGAYVSNKLQPRSLACVFLGYSATHRGYRCYHPPTGRVYTSRHVVFHEHDFLYSAPASTPSNLTAATGLVSVPVVTASTPLHGPDASHLGIGPQPHLEPISSPTQSAHVELPGPVAADLNSSPIPSLVPADLAPSPSPSPALVITPASAPTAATHLLAPAPNDPTPVSATARPSPSAPASSSTAAPQLPPPAQVPDKPRAPPSTRTSPVHTRSKSGIFKPKFRSNFMVRYPIPSAFIALADSDIEPTCYTQASRFSHWQQAMYDEFNALLKQGTWSLVPLPPSVRAVGCKWVFKIKRNSDGSIERYKARLVAKGYHQQPGIDYFDTYSPVVKPTTIRTVLSLAISSGWTLRQLDVNNAFLHGTLSEDVYMQQPPGFIDPTRPQHVCKLHKALYGLKQAPRAWFQRLSSFLIRYGFLQSRADSSMFIFRHNSHMMVLLLYVDDIVLTGSSTSSLLDFIRILGAEFDLKDLGHLHYFLGYGGDLFVR
ncbi:unnamed protein product [Prunus brigantina]